MKGHRIKHVSRERDEELLDQIRARARGASANAMAKRYGINSGILINATNNVLAADIEESGEPESLVRRAYW